MLHLLASEGNTEVRPPPKLGTNLVVMPVLFDVSKQPRSPSSAQLRTGDPSCSGPPFQQQNQYRAHSFPSAPPDQRSAALTLCGTANLRW